MKKQSGFTLIELMIVVAIAGILAAAALSAYFFHATRARVAEALVAASAAKHLVAENSANGMAPAAGFTPPPATRNLSRLTISETGVITATTTAAAGGGTIILEPIPALVPGVLPASPIRWSCTGGSLPAHYRPSECR